MFEVSNVTKWLIFQNPVAIIINWVYLLKHAYTKLYLSCLNRVHMCSYSASYTLNNLLIVLQENSLPFILVTSCSSYGAFSVLMVTFLFCLNCYRPHFWCFHPHIAINVIVCMHCGCNHKMHSTSQMLSPWHFIFYRFGIAVNLTTYLCSTIFTRSIST